MRNIRGLTLISMAFVGLAALSLAGCSSPETRAKNYYESGKKLMAEHNTAIAAVQFRNAVSIKKDMLPAWRGLAEAEEDNHHWNAVASALRTILELDPKDDTTRLKLAKLLLAGGAADESLKLVNDLSTPDSANADVLALKAAISYRLKDNDAAEKYAQSAVKIEPSIDAVSVLAAIKLEENDPNGALDILHQYSLDQSDNPGIELLRVRIYGQLKDYSQLENLLKTMAARDPKSLTILKQLAGLYIFEHRNQDAETELKAIVAADPKSSEDVLALVQFILATKGAPAARRELVDQIKAGAVTDVVQLELALAQLDFNQGNADESFQLLNKLAQSDTPDSVKAKIELAQLYLRQKNSEAAEKIVDGILKDDARNVDALKLRAVIHLNRNQIDGAISDAREALNDQPNAPDVMLLLATAYERGGSIDLAGKEYLAAAKTSNFAPNIGLAYVAFLQRHGNLDQAYDFLGQLAEHQPRSLPVLTALAQMKLERQDWDGAEKIASVIKQLSKTPTIADQISGAALSGEKKYDQSIVSLQNAVTADPSAPQPLFSLIATMIKAKEFNRALSFLSSVVKSSPDNAEAYVLMGDVQVVNGKPAQGEMLFKTAIQKQPKNELGYRALASLYVRQKNYDAALAVVQNGLKQAPNNPTLQMTLASALQEKGDYEGAISEYENLLRQDPGSTLVANNLASLLADHRTDKASLEQAQALAARLQSTPVPQFKDTLGWVDYRRGDFKSAIPLLQAAEAGMPNVALVHYHLGMTYLGDDQPSKASKELDDALKNQPSNDLEAKINAALKSMHPQ